MGWDVNVHVTLMMLRCTFWLSCSDGTQSPHLLKAVGSLATKASR